MEDRSARTIQLRPAEPPAFGFLVELLRRESAPRWVILDHFPPFLSRTLLTEMKSESATPVRWLLLDDALSADSLLAVASGACDIVVLDALHTEEGQKVASILKKLLAQHETLRLLILGNGRLKGLEIPDYYGVGSYLSCDHEIPETRRIASHASDDSLLLQHSMKLTPRYHLDDLVLGPKALMKFMEGIDYIRTKEICEWELGFRERHSRGHGVTLLFHGASGTGKTMAAEVVASTLGLALYQIDLSSVVSKWVGETEKNLKSIFRAAKGVKGILLFDEGDAIFGQRTQVKESQDRYANLEVNYLLQELERFDGIVILSTNYEKNMDAAFLRRFTYTMTFAFPSNKERELIWKRNIPRKLPLGKTVDFEHLSLFALSGGKIKNCIRDAAAIAVTKGRRILEQEDLLWAIKRELQKDGVELDRALVGEDYWKKVAPEWEYQFIKSNKKAIAGVTVYAGTEH